MFISLIHFLQLSMLAALASAIPHDEVQSFPESVGDGESGKIYLKYKPYLKVENGCVPFPAVQADGSVSGGLQNTGAMNGQCSKSTGQVYVRSASLKGRFAVMYSWYFPKDMPRDGTGGHRHDWEQIVVWLSEQTLDAKVTGVSFSSHSGWKKYKPAQVDFDNDHPKVKYFRIADLLNHGLDTTIEKGGQQPLVNWPQLTKKARDTLNTADFGDASVKFRDDNHIENLVDSWEDGY